MDGLDLTILRAMGLHPFEPWARASSLRVKKLARNVQASEKTIRDRLRKLERGGTLAGYEAYPNLHHLGLEWTTFHYTVATRGKARALAAIEDVEGVAAIQDHVGEHVYVDLYYATEDEMRQRTRLLKTLLGDGFLDWVDHEMPPVARALTQLDWRIAEALRGRGRRPLAEVARELRVTARTVERRISTMVSGGDLYIVPRVDWSRTPNLIPFSLLLEVSEGATLARVTKAAPTIAPDCCRGSWAPACCEPGDTHVNVALYASSTTEMESLRERFAAMDGVRSARVLLPASRREPRAWLDGLVRRFAEGASAKATQQAPRASLTPKPRTKGT